MGVAIPAAPKARLAYRAAGAQPSPPTTTGEAANSLEIGRRRAPRLQDGPPPGTAARSLASGGGLTAGALGLVTDPRVRRASRTRVHDSPVLPKQPVAEGQPPADRISSMSSDISLADGFAGRAAASSGVALSSACKDRSPLFQAASWADRVAQKLLELTGLPSHRRIGAFRSRPAAVSGRGDLQGPR